MRFALQLPDRKKKKKSIGAMRNVYLSGDRNRIACNCAACYLSTCVSYFFMSDGCIDESNSTQRVI
jgi:hypothetical protein